MSKTILIVDDSSSVRFLVKSTLESAGFHVIEADDGTTGLDQLNGQKIHLIISDVNMPGLDGIKFVEQAKQIPKYKFTPVIMLTTESGMTMKNAGRKVGAKAWMVKPFDAQQMIAAVAKLT
jgi:two-component system chemotaxis response regulator CheY